MRQVPSLLAFHIEPREAFAPLSDIDPYACNLRLRAISAGDRDEIATDFSAGAGSGADHQHSAGCASAAAVHVADAADQTLIRTVIEAQCELLRVSDRTDDFAGCAGAAARVADKCFASRPSNCNWRIPCGAPALSALGAARRRTIAVRA